jgi:hypothetical protein
MSALKKPRKKRGAVTFGIETEIQANPDRTPSSILTSTHITKKGRLLHSTTTIKDTAGPEPPMKTMAATDGHMDSMGELADGLEMDWMKEGGEEVQVNREDVEENRRPEKVVEEKVKAAKERKRVSALYI